MRKVCLHGFFVSVFVASFVGCGGHNTTTSVPPVEGMNKSGEAAGRQVMDSSAAGQPNTPGAMPSYYGQGYPTGQTSAVPGGPGGGQPGGAPQQPGR